MASTRSSTFTDCRNVIAVGDVAAGGDVNFTIQSGEAQRIFDRTASRIREWTRGMIKTSALTKLLEKLNRGVTWVTIKGQPGEGKTTAAYMALEELHRSGRQVFEITTPAEFSEVAANYPKPVIMLDDVFGNLEFDQTEWTKWRPVLHHALGEKEHRSHENRTEISKEKEVTVILVGRDYVLNSASTDIGRFSDYFTRDEHVVYMSHTGERDIQEKLAIWKAISEASGIELDEKTIDTICKISVPHGFPHVCRLFVTMHKEDPNINVESFFKAPLEFLNQTVQKFMKDKVKLALFKEMIKRNGTVNIRDLENVDNCAEIIDIADNLVGTYLSEEDGNFTFNHPSVYDSVAFCLCKNSTSFVIENCHLSFLHERLRLGQSHDTGHESSLVVNIPRCFIGDLAKRFAVEIENRNLRLVLSHKALTDQLFIEELMCSVKVPLTELLIFTDKQIDEDSRDRNKRNRLDLKERHSFLGLVASSKSPQLLKYIDNQTDIHLTERDINTVLYGVCKYAASGVLTYLVQSRDTLHINVKYDSELTPLMIASATRDSLFVQQIMSLGPDLNARDSEANLSVLHYLCINGLYRAVEQVIDRVGGIDVEAGKGGSPLWFACWHNQVDVARVLIDRGARINEMILLFACRHGYLDVVKLLWERVSTFNMTGFSTPLTKASEGGHVKVMRFLTDKGASVNTVDGIGRSPLHWACYYNKPQAVQWLLEHGADINTISFKGYSPLDLAEWDGHTECIDLLQK